MDMVTNVLKSLRPWASRNRPIIHPNVEEIQDFDSDREPFTLVETLGRGSYGVVQAVGLDWNSETSRRFEEADTQNLRLSARKRFEHPDGTSRSAAALQQKEFGALLVLSKLSDNDQYHMVRLIKAYTVNRNGKSPLYYMITTPVAGSGNLTQFLDNKPSTSVLERLMGCLVTGLAILHKAKIRHHDIHPGNILVDYDSPLYTDFGLSYHFPTPEDNQTNSKTKKERRHHGQFAAPEYLEDLERGRSADVFGLGGVLYEIAAVLTQNEAMLRHRPTESNTMFGSASDSENARAALHAIRGERDERLKLKCGPLIFFWLENISKMLEFDAQKRPSAVEVVIDYFGREENPFCLACTRWYVGQMEIQGRKGEIPDCASRLATGRFIKRR